MFSERGELWFFLALCVGGALALVLTLRFAPQIDGPAPAARAAEDCKVFVTSDAGYRAMLVECTVRAPKAAP